MTHPQTLAAVDGIDRAHQRLLPLLDRLTDEQVAAPSALPGWTRGHVLAHLHGLGTAVARQLRGALDGEVLELYVGGRPARDAAIEAGAGFGAREHAERVRTALAQVEDLLDEVTPEVLARPSGYRGRTTDAVVLAWWREVAIHVVDLDLGIGTDTWDEALRDQLAEFLAPRVPDGVQVVLEPLDADERRVLGTGEPVVVRGAVRDLFAWLAGREPEGEISAGRAGEPTALPELGAWP